MNRIFLEPCYHGEYPADVVAVFAAAGLNAGEVEGALVQPGDLELVAAPTDFVGVNHYTNVLVYAGGDGDEGNDGRSWVACAWSTSARRRRRSAGRTLRLLCTTCCARVNKEFSPLPILVTENGASLHDYVDPNGEVRDFERIDYLRGYIDAVAQAVEEGVDVRGYFAWSFLDNFEWAEGYDKRFGLVFVDYGTQLRIPKASAYWYRDTINTFHGLERTPR